MNTSMERHFKCEENKRLFMLIDIYFRCICSLNRTIEDIGNIAKLDYLQFVPKHKQQSYSSSYNPNLKFDKIL